MYAINHAAAALILKKQDERLPLFALLIAAQLMELLWILFSYAGLEYVRVTGGVLHLEYLPFSHSAFSAFMLAAFVFMVTRKLTGRSKPAILLAIAVISHLVLDLITHEADIRLSPFSAAPSFGMGITLHPVLDLAVETAFGLLCWKYYRGSWSLFLVILGLNLLNIPFMFARGQAVESMSEHPFVLPSVILFQILLSWWLVYRFSVKKGGQPENRLVSPESRQG